MNILEELIVFAIILIAIIYLLYRVANWYVKVPKVNREYPDQTYKIIKKVKTKSPIDVRDTLRKKQKA